MNALWNSALIVGMCVCSWLLINCKLFVHSCYSAININPCPWIANEHHIRRWWLLWPGVFCWPATLQAWCRETFPLRHWDRSYLWWRVSWEKYSVFFYEKGPLKTWKEETDAVKSMFSVVRTIQEVKKKRKKEKNHYQALYSTCRKHMYHSLTPCVIHIFNKPYLKFNSICQLV